MFNMYISMNICIYVYIYVCISIYVCEKKCIYIYVCIYLYKNLRMNLNLPELPEVPSALNLTWGTAQQVEFRSAGSSPNLRKCPATWISLCWEFPSAGSSPRLGVPLLWEFHSSGSSTLLGVPPPGSSSFWEFHSLKFPHSERWEFHMWIHQSRFHKTRKPLLGYTQLHAFICMGSH